MDQLGFHDDQSPRFKAVLAWTETCAGEKNAAGWSWSHKNHWVVVSHIFYFHPFLGKIPKLTNIFQMGWFNHQPDQCSLCSRCFKSHEMMKCIIHDGTLCGTSARHWPDNTPNDKFRLFSTGGQRRYFIHSNSHIEVGGSWWKVIFVPGTVYSKNNSTSIQSGLWWW